MKRMLCFELRRAFCNRMFVIAAAAGCLIALLQVFERGFTYVGVKELAPDMYPPSVFNCGMGLTIGIWQFVFYMIFPILAAMPYADSYLADMKTGYIKNICLKTKKRYYLTAKLVAVFLSGGCAVLIPILFNLLLVSLCVPAVTPHAATGFFWVFANAAGADLFYTVPFLYVLLFALLLFFTAGIFACTALAFSHFIRYSYALLLAPFLLFLSISYGSTLFSFKSPFNISQWILPTQSHMPLNLPVAALEMGGLLVITLVIYFVRGVKNEAV